jgi:hypothetical protein
METQKKTPRQPKQTDQQGASKMTEQTTTTNKTSRESDGRFALKMESKRSVSRWMKRDAEREARRLELEAECGDMADCFA